MGNARDVGVVGVAVFPERHPIYYPPPLYRPYPYPRPRTDDDLGRSQSSPEVEEGVEGGVVGGVVGGRVGGEEASPPSAAPHSKVRERSGLGTEFAEQHSSHVQPVSFERASPTPAAVLTLRYNDRPGLLALGIDVDRRGWYSGSDTHLWQSAEPFRQNASFSQPPPGWRR
jgi:hypothetical protein